MQTTPTTTSRPTVARRFASLSMLCLLLMACFVIAPKAIAQPSPQNQQTDPAVVKALLAIEQQAKNVKTYQALLRFDQIQSLTGSEQTRFGKIFYVHGKPVQFAVHFTSLVTEGQRVNQDRQWIFDGNWLVEKSNDIKQFIKRQIADPKAPVDPLSIESTKFPIPLRPNKDEVLSKFQVQFGKLRKGDPANSFALVLTPRPNSGIKLTEVTIWYDSKSLLPVKAVSINDNAGEELVYSLFKPQLNQQIDKAELDTTTPRQSEGWDVIIKPWE